ncbi:MAG: histidine kinase [Phenylobacterium sp.]
MSDMQIQGDHERERAVSSTPRTTAPGDYGAQRRHFSDEKPSGVAPAKAPRPVGADYRALFDQSEIPVALVSGLDASMFVAASRGFLDMFDLRRAAIAGRSLDDVFTTAENTELEAAIRRCLMTSETVHASLEVRNGATHHVIGLAVHPTRARGFAGHVVLEAEGRGHTVYSQIQRFSSLVGDDDAVGQPMTYIYDAKRRRLRYTEGPLAVRLGLHGAVTSEDVRAMVHPDDLAVHASYQAARNKLSDDKFVSSTLRLRDARGEWRLISLRGRVLRRDRDGAVRMILGSATDITDYAAAAVEAAGISVQRAEENERARIGRELHDSTSQYLVAASLGLGSALRTEGLPDALQTRLRDVQNSLEMAQAEIRAFSYFLHPPELRELGLRRTVEKFCAGFARRSGLAIAFKARQVPRELSSDSEHALFRVCQEALMNVYRHAFARGVTVELTPKDGHVVLEVRDDGVGVDGVDRFEHGGIGVAGMRARMRSVGGDLSLDYLGPGLGVVARVPAPAPVGWTSQ